MKKFIAMVSVLFASTANAHEWTPTYPEIQSYYMTGIMMVRMNMFNKREDVKFYEISIFDDKWNPLPFAADNRIFRVDYLQQKSMYIYFKEKDKDKITYICTTSKMLKNDSVSTNVKSRICSKIKRD